MHDGEQLVGFVMISDNIEDLGEDLVGPYYLWRLLIDEAFQGRGSGAATIDAVVEYLGTRPNRPALPPTGFLLDRPCPSSDTG